VRNGLCRLSGIRRAGTARRLDNDCSGKRLVTAGEYHRFRLLYRLDSGGAVRDEFRDIRLVLLGFGERVRETT
jgi:hypothetical protein